MVLQKKNKTPACEFGQSVWPLPMVRKPMVRDTVLILVAVVLSCALACDVERLESRAGEHVVYYWSPRDSRLCGGTIEHTDRLLEVMADHYSLPRPGPQSVSYFWVEDSAGHVCPTLDGARACALAHPNGPRNHAVAVVSPDPIDAHELGHAASMQPNRGQPSFLSEGLAMRWSMGLNTGYVVDSTFSATIGYPEVVALLDRLSIDGNDYFAALLIWVWLEAEFGAEKMAALVRRLNRRSSVAEVEAMFVDIFGMTLEQAVIAHQDAPLLEFDDPVCAMDLPRKQWTDAGIDLDGQAGACESANFINLAGRAGQVHLLELPETGQHYQLTVEDTPRADVYFYPCSGHPRPYSPPPGFGAPSSGDPLPPLYFQGGLHAVYVLGDLDDNGEVVLPHVELRLP
jgi:hypothetical protein